ncbi:hypothetical protein C8F04DRAFT_1185173 [Mycena alexandri]|uniref:Uncharacterized protein n=1 Tax=Mycena alexandri TaxID=1745969 RepID=A0AAD6SR43_9AGAR|nr:hypothetical protein C8F04DRAFT_1185173 [Mycena alexandri]
MSARIRLCGGWDVLVQSRVPPQNEPGGTDLTPGTLTAGLGGHGGRRLGAILEIEGDEISMNPDGNSPANVDILTRTDGNYLEKKTKYCPKSLEISRIISHFLEISRDLDVFNPPGPIFLLLSNKGLHTDLRFFVGVHGWFAASAETWIRPPVTLSSLVKNKPAWKKTGNLLRCAIRCKLMFTRLNLGTMAADNTPCNALLQPRIGLKQRNCGRRHISNGQAMTSAMENRPCTAARWIFVPVNPEIRKVLIVHPKNTAHNHPIPPALPLD